MTGEAAIDYIRSVMTPLEPLGDPLPAEGFLPGGIKVVLFDVYGTLLISAMHGIPQDFGAAPSGPAPRRNEAMRAVIVALGEVLPGTAPTAHAAKAERWAEDYDRLIATLQDRRRAEGVAYPEIDILAVWKEFLATHLGEPPGYFLENPSDDDLLHHVSLIHECAIHPVWEMPGSLDLIKELKAAGFILGIVSNAQWYTPKMLEALLGESLEQLGFDPELIVYSYQHGYGKPAPELYQQVIARLAARGIPPQEAIMVGNDQVKDIQPARQLGLQTVWFHRDNRTIRFRRDHHLLALSIPSLVISEWPELARRLCLPT
jgi:putative hydrolase of the HAD superfamily